MLLYVKCDFIETVRASMPTSSGDSNLGVIIGTVLGACAIILTVVVILLLMAYRRSKRKVDKNK